MFITRIPVIKKKIFVMKFHLNSIISLMFEGRKICMNIHNLAISFIYTGMK